MFFVHLIGGIKLQILKKGLVIAFCIEGVQKVLIGFLSVANHVGKVFDFIFQLQRST